MATLFTVGEMAKLSNISKQTLIFYDRKGVFSPNYVDPDNGYRYYSADQLELLDKEGNVLTSAPVYVPVVGDATFKHIIPVTEGGNA